MNKTASLGDIVSSFDDIADYIQRIRNIKQRVSEAKVPLKEAYKKYKAAQKLGVPGSATVTDYLKQKAILAQILSGHKKDVSSLKTIGGLSAGATAVGVGGGAAYSALEDKIKGNKEALNEKKKIETNLSLKELQSDISSDKDVFGKQAGLKGNAAIIGASLAAGSGIIGHKAFQDLKEVRDLEKKKELMEQIKTLRSKYNQKFRQSMLGEFNIEPTALKEEADILKTSGLKSMLATAGKTVLDNPVPTSLAILGASASVPMYAAGKEQGDEASKNIQDLKKYRATLERVSRMHNAPVNISETSFSPEEMVAMQKLRTTSPVKKSKKTKEADIIKNTKGGTEAPTVSAAVDDPELQELLGSV